MIGMSEAVWFYNLPVAVRKTLPPLTFVHVHERPYCRECREEERFPPTVGRDDYVPYRVEGMAG
jgi:hypothetical protein